MQMGLLQYARANELAELLLCYVFEAILLHETIIYPFQQRLISLTWIHGGLSNSKRLITSIKACTLVRIPSLLRGLEQFNSTSFLVHLEYDSQQHFPGHYISQFLRFNCLQLPQYHLSSMCPLPLMCLLLHSQVKHLEPCQCTPLQYAIHTEIYTMNLTLTGMMGVPL